MATDLGWQALQWPGLEHVILLSDEQGSRADSRLVLAEDELVRVQYQLTCDYGWRFSELSVGAATATWRRRLSLDADADSRWVVDGQHRPDLDGCIDVDINCTPFTNTLPVLRLDWSAAMHDLDVAYVRVPELDVSRARQRYTLLDRGQPGKHALFRYESGSFAAEITVDADGFVIDYPGLWSRVVSGRQTSA